MLFSFSFMWSHTRILFQVKRKQTLISSVWSPQLYNAYIWESTKHKHCQCDTRVHVQVDASQNQQNRQKIDEKKLEQGLPMKKSFLSNPKVKIWVNKLQFDNIQMKFLEQLFMNPDKTAHILQCHYWFSVEMTSEK